jgi:hypothetical protein
LLKKFSQQLALGLGLASVTPKHCEKQTKDTQKQLGSET